MALYFHIASTTHCTAYIYHIVAVFGSERFVFDFVQHETTLHQFPQCLSTPLSEHRLAEALRAASNEICYTERSCLDCTHEKRDRGTIVTEQQ